MTTDATQKPAAVVQIERHGYAVTSVPGFLSNHPPASLEERARAIIADQVPLIPPHLLCVLHDASEGAATGDSYMLIGPDPEALARECIEHLGLEG